MACEICGGKDLFSEVTGEGVCAICKLKYVGGLPSTKERIQKVREALNLKAGEYLNQNCHEKL